MPRRRQRRDHPLLEVDPELGRLVAPDRREAADRELRVELYGLHRGEWRSEPSAAAAAAHVGLLLLDGVVSREVVVADCVSTELLGAGDVLRPWGLDDADRLLRHAVRWNALTESRVAVLDRRVGNRLGEWPEVNAVLIDRMTVRVRRLAATQAISQLPRVERRLSALLWHLAERWGRMTPEGVVVALTLSHRMLAQLVGARRPTVSTALARLAHSGQVSRRDNGTWLLTGEPAGLPAGAAERVMGSRGEPPCTEPPAYGSARLDDVSATLRRLREDAAAGVASLRETSEQTRALLARMNELRAELSPPA